MSGNSVASVLLRSLHGRCHEEQPAHAGAEGESDGLSGSLDPDRLDRRTMMATLLSWRMPRECLEDPR